MKGNSCFTTSLKLVWLPLGGKWQQTIWESGRLLYCLRAQIHVVSPHITFHSKIWLVQCFYGIMHLKDGNLRDCPSHTIEHSAILSCEHSVSVPLPHSVLSWIMTVRGKRSLCVWVGGWMGVGVSWEMWMQNRKPSEWIHHNNNQQGWKCGVNFLLV